MRGPGPSLAIAGLVLTLAGCARKATPGEPLTTVTLALRARGADVAAPSAIELRRLGGERVTVDDPHEHRAIELEGVRATTLFDATLGPSWRNAEEIVATCVDGFHPAIPVSLFLEHDAYVAYARPDSADFAIQESPTKRTAVGPYYVVWKKEAGQAPPEPAWPFEVTALEATDFATRFAAAIPPRDAGALAQEGFERFRTFCLPCHTINGAGGAVGPELNYPVSVTEYFAGPVLRQWITDPNRVRWNAKMPPPLPADAEQPRAIEAIVGYLEAMAGAKREPRRQ